MISKDFKGFQRILEKVKDFIGSPNIRMIFEHFNNFDVFLKNSADIEALNEFNNISEGIKVLQEMPEDSEDFNKTLNIFKDIKEICKYLMRRVYFCKITYEWSEIHRFFFVSLLFVLNPLIFLYESFQC